MSTDLVERLGHEAQPRSHTTANLFRRLGQKPDPWSHDGISPQPLESALRTLQDDLQG